MHDSETHRWHLEAFARRSDKTPEHVETCVGDRALDAAMLPLEAAGYEIKVRSA